VSIKNIGTSVLDITNITSSLSVFAPSITNFSVSPGQEQFVDVMFTPIDSVVYSGILTFTSNDPLHPIVDIVALGRGGYPPIIAISPDSLSVDLPTGQTTTRTITISNTGASNLSFDATLGFGGSSGVNILSASKAMASSSYRGAIQAGAEYKPDQVIVKFKETSSPSRVMSVRSALHATVKKKFKKMRAEVWKLSGISVADAIARYEDDPNIEYIQPNYKLYVLDRIPNDPKFSQLWGMQKISAPAAWDMTTGTNIVIGDIDTGIDPNHEDLSANIWTNPGEIEGNGIDDDGNGYIDDIHGWNFCNDDNDPYDDHSHGTHTAGTIAARGNNGVGVVGVCWSAKIMALKFLDAFGGGWTDDAVSAIEYATMMHARLTSNSWGGPGYDPALYDAIKAAGDAGVLFVAAAGNDARNTDITLNFPSCFNLDNIISVASTTSDDGLSYFSNYGPVTVDLGAPGSDVYSTIPGNSYTTHSGTSMATPHVSGVAGLILSLNPLLNWSEVKNIILSSVDTIPSLAGKTVTGGRLNAAKALQKIQTWVTLNPLSGTVPPGASVDLTVTFDATHMLGGDYRSTIIINSNDPMNSPKDIPARIHIAGNTAIAITPDTVKAGVVYIGMNHVDIVKVKNVGTDVLNVTNITSSLPVFTTNITNFSISSGGEQPVEVRFAPTASMVYSGILTITSSDPLHPTVGVVLQGQGVYPPVITVSPDSLSLVVNQGGSAEAGLLINNSGGSPLTYEIGIDYSLQAQTGSSYKDKAMAFKWTEWIDKEKFLISTSNARPIHPIYAATSLLPIIIQDPVGDAYYFDISEIRGEVSGGMLTLQIVTATPLAPVLDLDALTGSIGLDVDQNIATGIRLYPFLIPEQEVGCEYLVIFDRLSTYGVRLIDSSFNYIGSYVPIIDTDGRTITFSIPLTALGNDNGEMNIAAGISTFIAFEYDDAPDVGHGTLGPRWLSVEPSEGIVTPGSSRTVSVKVDAKAVSASLHQAILTIYHNDPFHSTKNVPVKMYVQEGYFSYALNKGWNLVSVPFLQTNDSTHVIFPGKYGAMFRYDQVLCDYVESPALALGMGYWVCYTGATTITISGAAPASITIACKAGWNLIGSREREVQVSNLQLSAGSIYGSAFRYDTNIGDYAETTGLIPGEGTWIYVTMDCELTIPKE
jgi:subtilisin family serine protease